MGRPGAAADGDGSNNNSNLSRPAERPMAMSQIMQRLVTRAVSRADAAARVREQASLLEAALAAARARTREEGGRGTNAGLLLRFEAILSSVGREAVEMLRPGGADPAAIAARRSPKDGSLVTPDDAAAVGDGNGNGNGNAATSSSSSSVSSRWPREAHAAATEGARLLVDALLTAASSTSAEPPSPPADDLAEEPQQQKQPATEAASSWAKVFIEGLDLLAAVFSSVGETDFVDAEEEEGVLRRSLDVRRSAADLRAALGLEDPDAALESALAAAAAASSSAAAAASASAATVAVAAADNDLTAQHRFSRRARGMRVDERLGAEAAQVMLRERGEQRDAAARVLLREFRAALGREQRRAAGGERGGRGGRGRGGRRGVGRRGALAGAAAGQQTASVARASAAAASEFHALVHALNQSSLNQQEAERQNAAAVAAAAEEEEEEKEEKEAEATADETAADDPADASCAVCLESFGVVSRAVTPCGHVFCLECIREALFSFRRCPLCRKPTRHDELLLVRGEGKGEEEEGEGEGGNKPTAAAGASSDRNRSPTPVAALSTALIASDLRLDALRAEHGAKMAAAVAAVAESAAAGGKVVVFSAWSRLLRLFGHALTSVGLRWVSLAGSIPDARATALESFKNDSSCSALLVMMSTAGGAAGLDLGHATCALLLEPSLNPGLEAQAAARIQRLGQTRETRVVRLISARTLDAAVAAVAAERARAAPSEAAAEAAEAAAANAAPTLAVQIMEKGFEILTPLSIKFILDLEKESENVS